MKSMRLLFVLFLIIPLCSCHWEYSDHRENGHYNLVLVNNSEKNLYVQEQRYLDVKDLDSVLIRDDASPNGYIEKISLFFALTFSFTDGYWEDYFEKEKFIRYVLLDGDSVKKYMNGTRVYEYIGDSIRKHVPIIQSYTLMLQDLENINWTVTYPPTKEMKDVRMYPPYVEKKKTQYVKE